MNRFLSGNGGTFSDYHGIENAISENENTKKTQLAIKNEFIQQLKQYNPLMFDFAVKRLIQFNGVGFANKVFETRRVFES